MHHRHETAILLMVVLVYSCLSEFCLRILLNVLKLRSREFSAQRFYTIPTKWTMFFNQNETVNNFLFLSCTHCGPSLLIFSCQRMLLTNIY